MLLRHYIETGMSKRSIARKLKISPDMLYRWVRSGDLDRDVDEAPVRYGPRPPVPTKLDPFKLLIQARLDAFPQLSSVRLLEEIQADGYTGGYTQLKAYVHTVRPHPEPEPIVRFETPPAHQAQVDFATFKFPWGKRYALLVVLGYSRLLWLRFYPKQDMRTLDGRRALAHNGRRESRRCRNQARSPRGRELVQRSALRGRGIGDRRVRHAGMRTRVGVERELIAETCGAGG